MTAVSEMVDAGNLIGGAYRAAAAGRTFESRNPAHKDDVVGVFPRSDAADVDAAVAVAREAFDSFVQERLMPNLHGLGDRGFPSPPDVKEFPVHNLQTP